MTYLGNLLPRTIPTRWNVVGTIRRNTAWSRLPPSLLTEECASQKLDATLLHIQASPTDAEV